MKKTEIIKLLAKVQNPIILDIGCNDGTDTIDFIKTFGNITIYCFEPDKRAFSQLKKKIASLPESASEKISLFKTAISDKDGIAQFYESTSYKENIPNPYMENWNQSGSLIKPKEHLNVYPWCKFEKTVKVKTIRLDTWAAKHNITNINFIWADVRGAEENLINGGIETLNKTMYLYTKYNENQLYESDSSIKRITELLPNFEVVRIMPETVLLKNQLIG